MVMLSRPTVNPRPTRTLDYDLGFRARGAEIREFAVLGLREGFRMVHRFRILVSRLRE